MPLPLNWETCQSAGLATRAAGQVVGSQTLIIISSQHHLHHHHYQESRWKMKTQKRCQQFWLLSIADLSNIPEFHVSNGVLGLPWWLSQRWKIFPKFRRCMFDPWVGKIHWRRAWQSTPVFLPGNSHRQRNLAGYSPWAHRVRHN